jgi:hypothetical protein
MVRFGPKWLRAMLRGRHICVFNDVDWISLPVLPCCSCVSVKNEGGTFNRSYFGRILKEDARHRQGDREQEEEEGSEDSCLSDEEEEQHT